MAKMSFVGSCDIQAMLETANELDEIGPDVAIVIEFESREECREAIQAGFVKFSMMEQ